MSVSNSFRVFRQGCTIQSKTILVQRQYGQSRCMATIAPPVTQNATGSKGPTAMVFMNMGGPSTTDEVGDFLSRLFVSRPFYEAHPICV